jgi:hypothetical protein
MIFLLFCITDLCLDFIIQSALVVADFLAQFVFLCSVEHGLLSFFRHFLLLSEVLFLLGFNVSFSLTDNLRCLLPSLINFLVSSNFLLF